MAVSNSKKIVLGLILVLAYYFGQGQENQQKYEDLKSKDPALLSLEDKKFIAKVESERAKTELERKEYQRKEREKEEKDKPRRELMELQIAVRMTCVDIAKGLMKYPKSYEEEQSEDGIDNQNGKKIYYYTLHFSGVNAFNVRGINTIECYGNVGDTSHHVTYRAFN
ncbi:hypothetical protein [Serratia proteamaculans]